MPPLSTVGTSTARDGAYSSLSLISMSEALTSWLISVDTVRPVTGPQIRSGSCTEPWTIWPPDFGACAVAPGAMAARARIARETARGRDVMRTSGRKGARTVAHRLRGVQEYVPGGAGTGPAPASA